MKFYKVLALLAIIMIASMAQGQHKKSAVLLGGFSEVGYAGQFKFDYYVNSHFDYFELGVYAASIKDQESGYEIPIDVYSLQAGFNKMIPYISSKDNKFLTTIGIGGSFGYENVNYGNERLDNGVIINDGSSFLYGLYGVLEADLSITDNWSIITNYTHFYHFSSEVNKSKFMIGAGVKYTFF